MKQHTHLSHSNSTQSLEVDLHGPELLHTPLLNKGTAFSAEERAMFDLDGLLPPHIETIEEQVSRCYNAYQQKPTDLERHIYLRVLQDRNETLFYKLVLDHLTEMMPIIYTPVVGDACKKFSQIFRHPRGLFISYNQRDQIEEILDNANMPETKVIVVTDGERILGLGDQGAGGLGIPIGKLSLYTACGGINPAYTLPIILDVGTNNQELRDDPNYIGWRHDRITGAEYDEFLELFVNAVRKKFPNVLLQFEDFAQTHAYPLLQRYRDKLCTFNDDIQGTASVAVSALLAAVKAAGSELTEQTFAFLGAGSAGCGISEQIIAAMVEDGLAEEEARARFFMVDRPGLLHDKLTCDLMPFQKKLLQNHDKVKDWQVKDPSHISLEDVIKNAKPTVLVGVSGQPNQFTESIIKDMASYCKHPIVFPMSNPTSRCEAQPKDIIKWSNGTALVATGSPFDDVKFDGKTFEIAQSNNCYIFPGMGLGILASNARRVTDKMFMAASRSLADMAPAVKGTGSALMPHLDEIREVSKHIAFAVAKQAQKEGVADMCSDEELHAEIDKNMWKPGYQSMKRV